MNVQCGIFKEVRSFRHKFETQSRLSSRSAQLYLRKSQASPIAWYDDWRHLNEKAETPSCRCISAIKSGVRLYHLGLVS
jgi:hypothetical protein